MFRENYRDLKNVAGFERKAYDGFWDAKNQEVCQNFSFNDNIRLYEGFNYCQVLFLQDLIIIFNIKIRKVLLSIGKCAFEITIYQDRAS